MHRPSNLVQTVVRFRNERASLLPHPPTTHEQPWERRGMGGGGGRGHQLWSTGTSRQGAPRGGLRHSIQKDPSAPGPRPYPQSYHLHQPKATCGQMGLKAGWANSGREEWRASPLSLPETVFPSEKWAKGSPMSLTYDLWLLRLLCPGQ